ncbi:sterol desaturase family protein [Duganella sp. LX20W]|uniref:Sterol desaturase family protein n=1 Tax=Rugamonas brunnea TaxID=2758569 RepID=A0A7W2IDR7_9BURK|nr:sterol desaturase family protein [Rugamonas brunnea]MBA5639851.1 sterol desaturase family protein [Rugamonas brunnea]
MTLAQFAADVAWKSLPLLGLIMLAGLAERRWPAEAQRWRGRAVNLGCMAVYVLGFALLQQGTAALTVLAVNGAGGGWLALPADGWHLLPSFLVYTLVLDLGEYAFHRAQHRIPALWAMHSLHHSDTAMNATTTDRHFWLEPGIKMVTLYLAVGLLFKPDPVIVGMYAVLGLYNVVPHMNVRWGLGRAAFLINTPQFHRLHHSMLPQHYDCNFAGLFPVFDLLFGTYRQPAAGEYPPTGIAGGDVPAGVLEVLAWPLRGRLRKNGG